MTTPNRYKPLLGPCDSYQLEPFAYEWAWKMAFAQEQNNWSPNEIAVASDVADYKNPAVDPKFKHLFESVMAQLTTFDIERGDDAAETFLSIFQPAEIRHFFKRLVWEEGLHTRSYRYVIENLGIPLTIYDTWKLVPAMRARVEMAQQMSIPVEEIIGTHLTTAFEYHELDLDGQQALLRSMIFWFLIFEGVWFWASLLGPIQQLARLGYFKGGAEQFTYIARDECLVQGTEVLTPSGWTLVEDLTLETLLVQWHRDGTLTWTRPTNMSTHIADSYYEFDLSSRGYKQCVSAKHRYPYFTKDGNLKVVTAEEATPNPYSVHPVAGKLRSIVGEQSLTPRERFLIALQADGSLPSRRYTGSRSGLVPYRFTFYKPRKIEAFLDILADTGFGYKLNADDKTGSHTFTVKAPGGLTKRLSDWVEVLGRSLTWCHEFISEIGKWDGHVVRENPTRITYSSVDKSNVDIVQAIAALSGYRTKYSQVVDNRSNTFRDMHRVFISRASNNVCGGHMSKRRVDEEVRMYGIEVPSSFLLIRKDNCVSITGNSAHISFGVALIKEYLTQYPQCLTTEFIEQITQDTLKAIELEGDYISYCLQDGPILGYSVADHVTTAKFFANMRLAAVGLPQLFPEAYHAFPWMAEQMEIRKEKNFFETRVTEYQTGGALTWDD